MSEKKRSRRRKDEYRGPGDQQEAEKPTKDEYQVAKWMRKNIRTKKTKFLSHNVEYFTSNKAIDALLKSKFAEGASPLFTTREHIVEYLDVMLEHKFFHRAKKVPIVIDDNQKTVTNESSATGSGTPKPTKKDKEERKKKEKDEQQVSAAKSKDKDTETEASETTQGKGSCSKCASQVEETNKKRKRKIRLDMHPEQVFVDGSEAYVWIYDPIPIHYWIYGLILLLGAIVICLFPLWPPMLRVGVYYLSLAAAGFLVFILVLTIVRLIIFTIVWAVTGGRLNFWIFPNLTEDVGFFASFWPLYESKYVNDDDDDGKSKSDKRSKSKSKKKQKDKDSDVEDEVGGEVEPLEPEKIEEIKEHDAEIELRRRNIRTGDENNGQDEDSHSSGGDNSEAAAESSASEAKCSRTASESESEISGKDYEIINSSEVQNVN